MDLVLHVTAPTVEAEAFNVLMDLIVEPFHHSFDIPGFVNIAQIEAVYEEGELKVFLPFKDGKIKAHRKIDIQEF